MKALLFHFFNFNFFLLEPVMGRKKKKDSMVEVLNFIVYLQLEDSRRGEW